MLIIVSLAILFGWFITRLVLVALIGRGVLISRLTALAIVRLRITGLILVTLFNRVAWVFAILAIRIGRLFFTLVILTSRLIFITRLFRIALIIITGIGTLVFATLIIVIRASTLIITSGFVLRLRLISLWIIWATSTSCLTRLVHPNFNVFYSCNLCVILKLNTKRIPARPESLSKF